MGHDINGLHHVGHIVQNMGEAIERYRRLGFTVPPPAHPVLPTGADGTTEPFGVANTHVRFPGNFVELVAVIDDGAATRLPTESRPIPLHVPADKLPFLKAAIRATSENVATCLRRFQGVHILMFDTPDIENAAARLSSEGIGHGGVHTVQRPVETPAGARTEPVRYLEIDGTEPRSSPGLVPEGRIGLAENAPPEASDILQATDHPNGATGLVACLLCVADAALPEAVQRYASYIGRPARYDPSTRTAHFDNANLTLVAASALTDLLPGERPPALPAFVSYTLSVRDTTLTERLLRAGHVPFGRTPSGELFVPAKAALGTALVFREENQATRPAVV